jgi:hypothetical protein
MHNSTMSGNGFLMHEANVLLEQELAERLSLRWLYYIFINRIILKMTSLFCLTNHQ